MLKIIPQEKYWVDFEAWLRKEYRHEDGMTWDDLADDERQAIKEDFSIEFSIERAFALETRPEFSLKEWCRKDPLNYKKFEIKPEHVIFELKNPWTGDVLGIKLSNTKNILL